MDPNEWKPCKDTFEPIGPKSLKDDIKNATPKTSESVAKLQKTIAELRKENEKLKEDNARLTSSINMYKKGIDFKNSQIKGFKMLLKKSKEIKTEAVCDFADKLLADLKLLAKHEDKFRQSVIVGVIGTIETKKKRWLRKNENA